ncbi:MAG: sulfite exporter TauE/SafE family protein [Thermoleophilia bacterium]|nr:sulfite exporter TauE/SafE family protein [Thermoleophilia bacterium]
MTAEAAELVAVGLAAGVLSGVFGVGGGILFVPSLVVIAGLSQIEAAATSLAAMIPVAVVGAWRQHGRGNVRWRAAILLGAGSLVGVAGGAALAESLPEDALRTLFALLLLGVAARLAWSARRPARRGADGHDSEI